MSPRIDRRRLLTASALFLTISRFARSQQPGPTQQIDPNKPAGPQSGTPSFKVTITVQLKGKPVAHARVTIKPGPGMPGVTTKTGYTSAAGKYSPTLMLGQYTITVTSGKYTSTQTSTVNGGFASFFFELSNPS